MPDLDRGMWRGILQPRPKSCPAETANRARRVKPMFVYLVHNQLIWYESFFIILWDNVANNLGLERSHWWDLDPVA